MPDLECPAKTNCDFEFGGEQVFLCDYWTGGGGSRDEGLDGCVVVFGLCCEIEDQKEDVFWVEGEGRSGEVEAVEEGQRCRLCAS